MIEQHFRDGSALGCKIEYLRETKPLGTGGSLSLLPARPEHPLLVLNGDLLTEFDLGKMVAFHREGGYVATVGVHEYVQTVPLGVLDIAENRIVGFREKPSFTYATNAGIYLLDPGACSIAFRRTRPTPFRPWWRIAWRRGNPWARSASRTSGSISEHPQEWAAHWAGMQGPTMADWHATNEVARHLGGRPGKIHRAASSLPSGWWRIGSTVAVALDAGCRCLGQCTAGSTSSGPTPRRVRHHGRRRYRCPRASPRWKGGKSFFTWPP